MDEIREKKQEIREDIEKSIGTISDQELAEHNKDLEQRLFEFANFLESKIALLYVGLKNEVPSRNIIKKCYDYSKIVVLPAFNVEKVSMVLMKVDDMDKDLITGPRGILEPNPARCKKVPIDCIDIAIIPGIAMDEKGGRIGTGDGYYDRLIPKLPITTRKVGLAFENQILPQVPMESHDKHVDIIITESRIIYKI
ncbi:MAG: 5-formyltetrahydrofolate cyclo-ligase [Desulfobacteraceae bacterium]|nr:5-formyltetrahydrofolate cyclo-ligase [Desulfobacteraceae bacterium]